MHRGTDETKAGDGFGTASNQAVGPDHFTMSALLDMATILSQRTLFDICTLKFCFDILIVICSMKLSWCPRRLLTPRSSAPKFVSQQPGWETFASRCRPRCQQPPSSPQRPPKRCGLKVRYSIIALTDTIRVLRRA